MSRGATSRTLKSLQATRQLREFIGNLGRNLDSDKYARPLRTIRV